MKEGHGKKDYQRMKPQVTPPMVKQPVVYCITVAVAVAIEDASK